MNLDTMKHSFIERQFDLRRHYMSDYSARRSFLLSDILSIHALIEVTGARGVNVDCEENLIILSSYMNTVQLDFNQDYLSLVSSISLNNGLLPNAAEKSHISALCLKDGANIMLSDCRGLYCCPLHISPSLWSSNIYIIGGQVDSSAYLHDITERARRLYRDQNNDLFGLLEEIQELKTRLKTNAPRIEGLDLGSEAEIEQIAKLKRDVSLLQSAIAVAHERLTRDSLKEDQNDRP